MVVLGVHTLEQEVAFPLVVDLGVGNVRPTGPVRVDGNLEQIASPVVHIPVVVVRLVEEIESVQALDPTDAHGDIQVFTVVVGEVSHDRVGKLVGSVCVAVGYHRPVVGMAVDAGNHVGGKLEDLEFRVGALQSLRR